MHPAHLLCAALFCTTVVTAQEPDPADGPQTPAVLDVTVGAQSVQMRLIDPDGAPVEWFVREIADLTGEVYVFEDGVLDASAERRVKFLGTLTIERGRVADTAAALLRSVGIQDSLEVDGDGQPLHRLRLRSLPTPESLDDITETFAARLDGETLRLSVVDPEGGDPIELLQIVEFLEGTVFVFHASELRAPVPQPQRAVRGRNRNNNAMGGPDSRIHFVGELAIPRDRLLPRACSILGSSGWALVPLRAGAFDLIEVVSINGPSRATVSSRTLQVPVESVDEYADWTSLHIGTVVGLEHLDAQSASNQLRPLFASMGNQGLQLMVAPIGNDGLVVSGPAYGVISAVRMVREADRPGQRSRVTALITLEHLSEERAASILGTLFDSPPPGPGRNPNYAEVRITIQGPRRLAVTGPSSLVEEVRKAVETIDVPDVEQSGK